MVLLVILAQAVASLLLIIRRREIDGATLMLDSVNGVYALTGICAVFNSMLIIAVGGEWESMQELMDAGFFATRPISWVSDYIWMMGGSLVCLRGQLLLYIDYDDSSHLEFWADRYFLVFVPSLPFAVAILISLVTALILAVVPFRRKWRSSGLRWADVLAGIWDLTWKAGLLSEVSFVVGWYIGQIYEMMVLTTGNEMAAWGQQNWRWSDPLSDILFVY